MSIDLRAPVTSPITDGYRRLTSSPRVVVHHPGYPDDNTNELFALVATDGSSSAPGVQHGVVHTACAIFACNRFDGWLSATRDASKRHAVAPQGLLPVGDYYFHVPPEDSTVNEFANPTLSPYPIVPTFRFWPFPHSQNPAPWKEALIEERLAPEPAKQRDGTCRVTNHRESTESAHIIPASEKDWFGVNNMDKYSIWDSRRGQEVVNGDENVICLREDVHTLWDRMYFSFVPKLTSEDTYAWVVHVHKPSQEMHALYHNLQLQPLAGIRHEFLLARFAWDIYPSLQGFLQRMVTRRLKLPSGVEDVSGIDCKRLFNFTMNSQVVDPAAVGSNSSDASYTRTITIVFGIIGTVLTLFALVITTLQYRLQKRRRSDVEGDNDGIEMSSQRLATGEGALSTPPPPSRLSEAPVTRAQTL
ncbi:hypothetical protein MBLNU13_g08911t1 [Cladosporium sp. NU13]